MLHLITCHGRIMPRLAELLLSLCSHFELNRFFFFHFSAFLLAHLSQKLKLSFVTSSQSKIGEVMIIVPYLLIRCFFFQSKSTVNILKFRTSKCLTK